MFICYNVYGDIMNKEVIYYINMQDLYYKQPIPYVEVISTNVSNDGTFNDLNDMFEKLSLKVKPMTDKEIIFKLYEDCFCFGDEEKTKLNKYIKSISVKEKTNIFDYYD